MRHSSNHVASFINSFNPRICKRCDAAILNTKRFELVSIHASVKDATASIVRAYSILVVSIHASVKDATDQTIGTARAWIVSIHASVKDATQIVKHQYISDMSFNPRICKRCDLLGPHYYQCCRFQSTHL